MIIDCDEGMIVALLRNWRSNRLQSQGIRLASLRPRLIERQKGICPLCLMEETPELLKDNGEDTHIDHNLTVEEFTGKVLRGELTFDDAYRQLWADSNLRAVHRGCNYARKKKNEVERRLISPCA